MPIVGIHHIQLAMPQGKEAQARKFYGELMGLPETAKPPELAARGGAWFESALVRVHLGVDPDFRPAHKAHAGLLVEGLGELVLRLKEAGCPVKEDDALDGYARVYVSDPFGNRLELLERRTR